MKGQPKHFQPDYAMLRGFKDSSGVEWRVWEVSPSKAFAAPATTSLSQGSLQETRFANGWLCFESPLEKRRLAPIPAGWERQELATLEQFCRDATIVPPRRPRPRL